MSPSQTVGDVTYAENAGMHCMYGHANGNGRAALRMYHAQFPDRRMPDHRIFQRLYRQFHETRSFHVTRHDAGRRRTVRIQSPKESILNVVASESESRAVAHHVSVSHQTVCRVLNENHLHPFHFQRVQDLKLTEYLLRLVVDGTAMSAASGLHSSCAEQLRKVIVNTLHLTTTLSINTLSFLSSLVFCVWASPHHLRPYIPVQ
ncbi:DUF4817 domain-containing protein [Trichonephila clavipes]|nr:DUF4817 domain-containing protein [Trichonephila clavipes]